MTQAIQLLIDKINTLKQELESLRPIKPEYNSKITQKFQLEFNYYSNNIEGNTLTIGETKSLILKGMEASISKKFRDISEMKGHLDAYNTLGFLTDRILTANHLSLELTQNFIKNLHKIIFVEDEKKQYENSFVLIPAGDYKKHNNHVLTSTVQVFEYVEMSQVPQLMTDLLDWYNTARLSWNPFVLASIFHYKFIRIHPFGDGNGRMARLLMNLILQSS
jgi:Fic family protein